MDIICVKHTYFIKDNAVIGRLDTSDLSEAYGFPYFETMDFMSTADSGWNCNEHVKNAVDAVAVHDAWTTILCARYNAEAVVTVFMGVDVVGDSDSYKIVAEYERRA